MDIFKIISEQVLKESTLNKIAESVGVEPAKAEQVVKLGMPAILQALGRNASTTEGSKALAGALKEHESDKVEDIKGFFENADTIDGAKILSHAFQEKNGLVQKNLAKKVGVNDEQASGIMAQVAPLLMGILSQQKKKQNIDTASIPDLINSMLFPNGEHNVMDIFSNILDSDKDGKIIDDIGKLVGGFLKK